MPVFREGKVLSVTRARPGLLRARVGLDGEELDSVGFEAMLGPLAAGDRVVVNTTAVDLGLGTGGMAFILWNLDGRAPQTLEGGHIMKLRYTPWQAEVLAAEAPESPDHEVLAGVDSIEGMPVVVCSLHSQVAAVAAGIKAARPDARVGYLMTDGAALPIVWSDLVHDLSTTQLIDVTCTAGHAFGGDLEAVNVFSGLAALRHAARVDAAIAGMGPGVVGTGTVLGFTGMEQGHVLDAAGALGGQAIACARISFADARSRHQGVSHHTLTALRLSASRPCTVVVPELPSEQATVVMGAIQGAEVDRRHRVVVASGADGVRLLHDKGLKPTSMGRSMDEVPELFLAGAAAGSVAAGKL